MCKCEKGGSSVAAIKNMTCKEQSVSGVKVKNPKVRDMN